MKKLKVLFLCTGNSCRSQMAEGWARHLKGDIFEAYSAGVETHGLNPNAVKVMAEAGVDISQHQSKHLDDLRGVEFDHVVGDDHDGGLVEHVDREHGLAGVAQQPAAGHDHRAACPPGRLLGREVGKLQRSTAGNDRGVFNRIAKFADVSPPGLLSE